VLVPMTLTDLERRDPMSQNFQADLETINNAVPWFDMERRLGVE